MVNPGKIFHSNSIDSPSFLSKALYSDELSNHINLSYHAQFDCGFSFICIHGKNYSDNWHSIKKTEDLTMKQMFDISEKLVSEQSDDIYGVKTINWEDLIGDEQVISLSHTKVYVFSDPVLCLGKMLPMSST